MNRSSCRSDEPEKTIKICSLSTYSDQERRLRCREKQSMSDGQRAQKDSNAQYSRKNPNQLRATHASQTQLPIHEFRRHAKSGGQHKVFHDQPAMSQASSGMRWAFHVLNRTVPQNPAALVSAHWLTPHARYPHYTYVTPCLPRGYKNLHVLDFNHKSRTATKMKMNQK